jgi:hypothetical protein
MAWIKTNETDQYLNTDMVELFETEYANRDEADDTKPCYVLAKLPSGTRVKVSVWGTMGEAREELQRLVTEVWRTGF